MFLSIISGPIQWAVDMTRESWGWLENAALLPGQDIRRKSTLVMTHPGLHAGKALGGERKHVSCHVAAALEDLRVAEVEMWVSKREKDITMLATYNINYLT